MSSNDSLFIASTNELESVCVWSSPTLEDHLAQEVDGSRCVGVCCVVVVEVGVGLLLAFGRQMTVATTLICDFHTFRSKLSTPRPRHPTHHERAMLIY